MAHIEKDNRLHKKYPHIKHKLLDSFVLTEGKCELVAEIGN